MAIHVAIHHHTRYQYDRAVSLSPHIFRLRPAPHCRTPIISYSLNIKPTKHFVNWQQDPFGNFLARIVFPEKAEELDITVDVIADMTPINPFDFFVESYAEHYPFQYNEQEKKELSPYMEITEKGPLLREWLSGIDRSEQQIVDFLVDLNQRLWKDIGYNIRMEPGIQSCEETFQQRTGSCRDTGWLLVQILRHLGLAARFVSGYLIQLTADVKALDGPSGPEDDFTDLHAWAEVYVPGAGWIGLDPTSGLLAGEGHIPLACTPDPVSAAPVTGATDVCETEFSFDNSVQRIFEDPRVTKPYTDTQWQDILALGRQVDIDLQEHDVRLTMGGEPTFVSIDDMESPEWNTTADSPQKRKLAWTLTNRLYDAFAPGGFLYHGQGKWYPGEPLPRWKFACIWRKDRGSLWRSPELLANEGQDYGFGAQDCERFLRCLCKHLGVQSHYMLPGYEDIFYFLWEERKIPLNLDPLKKNLKEPLERQRLSELLEQGLQEPIGYVLPLIWNYSAGAWLSGPWEFRRQHMFLIPGNSPMGLRLPLNSLPWVAPDKREAMHERSQFDDFPPLDDVLQTQQYAGTASSGAPPEESQTTSAPKNVSGETPYVDVPQTAFCVEARQGRLYVFMPPTSYLEHYIELLQAVEATAEELAMPVVIEGYEPPGDPRIERILVTPDPGVIEVNVHPAKSWDELVSTIETLYEEARLSRLGAEKFMLDGRHTGTGGGNHVTFGGPTTADSPILRRPDVLRSIITYWQHHPGLSYLFSGLFIGPTSQAPRVDEGRDERLYELEVAFQQLSREDAPQFPWLVDRVLRNLLVDMTGNTHRAEFCIDKLYSPDSASGRLGLVEFRAFDMPPHARMSVVQMLLIRALLMRFWKSPYHHTLVRWGTGLHDRFMLPHYVEADLLEVVDDLQREGYAFQMEWLAPFFEFRFPRYGSLNIRGIHLELRMAIEPWHVLGEEATRSGMSRFVDSSVERLQVKISGLTDSRYAVTCNGRRIPLRHTGTPGEYVSGVRYQAWQPPSSLHPTIPVHSPLVFDIVDTWNNRSIGGCTYHVVHPGGRGYEDFPINANVAEGRRLSRFWDYGHTPGTIRTPDYTSGKGQFSTHAPSEEAIEPSMEEVNPEYPHTLDLRCAPRYDLP